MKAILKSFGERVRGDSWFPFLFLRKVCLIIIIKIMMPSICIVLSSLHCSLKCMIHLALCEVCRANMLDSTSETRKLRSKEFTSGHLIPGAVLFPVNTNFPVPYNGLHSAAVWQGRGGASLGRVRE